MEKAQDAFRTISEVAEDLDLPQHVLRFWETRFAQIKPLKRGGGRRYYRPEDIDLLKGIRHLLYGEGYTIRGVQRLIKDHGVRAVMELGRADGNVAIAKPAGPDIIQPEAEPTPQRKAPGRKSAPAGFERGDPLPLPPPAPPAGTVDRLRANLRQLMPSFRSVEPQARIAEPRDRQEPLMPPAITPDTIEPSSVAPPTRGGIAPASPQRAAASMVDTLGAPPAEPPAPAPPLQYPQRIHNAPVGPPIVAAPLAYPPRLHADTPASAEAHSASAAPSPAASARPQDAAPAHEPSPQRFDAPAQPAYGRPSATAAPPAHAPSPLQFNAPPQPAYGQPTPPDAAAAPARLPLMAADDISRLQATMLDLMDCRRLLDEAMRKA